MLSLLFASMALGAQCEPIPPRAVVETVVRGEVAFQNGDPTGLNAAADESRAQIACLGAPVGLSEAASVFRLWGYAAFVARDREASKRLLAIAKDLQPDYVMPPVVVPPHHPMRALYDEITPRPPSTRLLELPAGDVVFVNGVQSVVVPTDQPYILQQVDADGRMRLSALVGTGQPPPILAGMAKNPYGWGLSVLGSAQSWVRKGRTTVTFGPALRFDLPIAGSLGGDARLSSGLSVVEEGLVVVPDFRLGLRYRLGSARVGAAALIASHSGAPVAPGPALIGGLRTDRFDVDAMVGFAGGFTGGVALGAVLR